jgi:hypothetical protein
LEYVFPKDPKKSITIVFFSPKNFRGAGSFDRISPNSDWYKGGYAFGDRQRPYRLGLTKNFFSDELGLILEKASLREGEIRQYLKIMFTISTPKMEIKIFNSFLKRELMHPIFRMGIQRVFIK